MKTNVYAVIMAGGIGSRFWPKSRTSYPKQFLDILNTGETLLQSTFERFRSFLPAENILVVTSEEYVPIVQTQVPALPSANILAEPERKNTAPCIAYVSFKLFQQDPDACMIVAPSDHLIQNSAAFTDTCRRAVAFAEKEKYFVTMGVTPTHANTGYGYIKMEKERENKGIYPVQKFTEKPNQELAEQFLAIGDYLWNAGIFVWRAKDILHAFEKHLPDMYDVFAEGAKDLVNGRERDAIRHIYRHCQSVSIDYGIMERSSQVWVIPADFGWSDLGTWNSAYANFRKDPGNNAVSGTNIKVVNARGCMIHASDKKLVLMQGVEDLIVVDTDDVLMICRKENEQDIKQYVEDIKKEKGGAFI